MADKKRWIQRHVNDEFVKKAQKEGYVSRAAYKLLALQEKDQFLKPGMVVVDLGAAPGGWSQIARRFVGASGKIIALDLLPLKISDDLHFIQGDFNDEAILAELKASLVQQRDDGKADVILSDMAPNLSGNKTIDQPRSLHLVELALDVASEALRPGGTFLVKMFNGAGTEEVIASCRGRFRKVKIRKPKASRAESSEVYLLGEGFLGYNRPF